LRCLRSLRRLHDYGHAYAQLIHRSIRKYANEMRCCLQIASRFATRRGRRRPPARSRAAPTELACGIESWQRGRSPSPITLAP
jgi:hypothetical protein